MEKYILKYLQETSDNPIIAKYIDYLKVDLDSHLYGYGENLTTNYAAFRDVDFHFYYNFYKKLLRLKKAKPNREKNNILSFVNLPNNIERQFNLNLIGSIVQPNGNKIIKSKSLVDFYLYYIKTITQQNFNKIITLESFLKFEEFKKQIIEEYRKYNFKGLFIGNGEPFMFKLHLDIFKELHCPSFIFLHGLPGIYKLDTEKVSDFLLVWGDKIKENYISAGFEENKIKVIGHPRYKEIPSNIKLKNDLSNILVTTTSSIAWSPHGWNLDKFPLNDRSLIILYCYSTQQALQKNGVTHARLRLHPSVNKSWIKKFIDNEFFTLDYLPLNESLKKSTLVIGPTSTLWLETLLAGVNYIVYEPGSNGMNLYNTPLVPPFDGSEPLLTVANNEEDLTYLIKNRYLNNTKIIKDYIIPFDFNKVNSLIKL